VSKMMIGLRSFVARAFVTQFSTKNTPIMSSLQTHEPAMLKLINPSLKYKGDLVKELLVETIAARDVAIASKDATIASKNETIALADVALASKGAALALAIASKDEIVNAKDALIADKDLQILQAQGKLHVRGCFELFSKNLFDRVQASKTTGKFTNFNVTSMYKNMSKDSFGSLTDAQQTTLNDINIKCGYGSTDLKQCNATQFESFGKAMAGIYGTLSTTIHGAIMEPSFTGCFVDSNLPTQIQCAARRILEHLRIPEANPPAATTTTETSTTATTGTSTTPNL